MNSDGTIGSIYNASTTTKTKIIKINNMEKTPDIIIYNIKKTNNTETDFKRFLKDLEFGSPIAILSFKESNRSNNNKATNAFLRLHDTTLHQKTAATLNNIKFLDYKLIAFINYKVWNNELGKLIPAKQNQYYIESQQQQLHDISTVFPSFAHKFQEVAEEINAIEQLMANPAPEAKMALSINARYYGVQSQTLNESRLSAIASTIRACLDTFCDRNPL